ncbi:MAG: hypothetical protein EZS28_009358 [Streblomastix strix]|uniref:Uncharacterized protein n=1 Tax=Streblomastix strix TaxID=222440 RepID=A0A5J4WLB8_9EUKA|nr:MAG: hypothetical protein EZS28_009358 [Streblomastix strix]
MAFESDEDTRLELIEQFDEEIEDIIRDVKKMESTLIEDSKQTFIKTQYNGIEIIVRQSDGYINVSKIVVALKYNERTICASPKFAYTVTQIMDKINERIQLSHQLDDTTSMAVHADIVFNQDLEEKEIINNQLRQKLSNRQQDLPAAGVPIHHETQYILFLEQSSVDDGYITYSIRRQDESGMSPYRLQRLKK